jgi:lipoprotein signal peptidase
VRAFLRRAASIALLALIVDETLKTVARLRVAPCPPTGTEPCDRLVLAGPVWLMRTANAGSIGGFDQGLAIWIVLGALGVALIPIYAWRLGTGGWLPAAAVGLQTGGAFGNLLDRLLLGGATDVLYVGRGPIWNLADAAIVLGMVLGVWGLARLGFRPAPAATVAVRDESVRGPG